MTAPFWCCCKGGRVGPPPSEDDPLSPPPDGPCGHGWFFGPDAPCCVQCCYETGSPLRVTGFRWRYRLFHNDFLAKAESGNAAWTIGCPDGIAEEDWQVEVIQTPALAFFQGGGAIARDVSFAVTYRSIRPVRGTGQPFFRVNVTRTIQADLFVRAFCNDETGEDCDSFGGLPCLGTGVRWLASAGPIVLPDVELRTSPSTPPQMTTVSPPLPVETAAFAFSAEDHRIHEDRHITASGSCGEGSTIATEVCYDTAGRFNPELGATDYKPRRRHTSLVTVQAPPTCCWSRTLGRCVKRPRGQRSDCGRCCPDNPAAPLTLRFSGVQWLSCCVHITGQSGEGRYVTFGLPQDSDIEVDPVTAPEGVDFRWQKTLVGVNEWHDFGTTDRSCGSTATYERTGNLILRVSQVGQIRTVEVLSDHADPNPGDPDVGPFKDLFVKGSYDVGPECDELDVTISNGLTAADAHYDEDLSECEDADRTPGSETKDLDNTTDLVMGFGGTIRIIEE